MSTTFGSNLKDSLDKQPRRRPKGAIHSGYGQQPRHSAIETTSLSPPQKQEGKIKHFLNLDDIPDNYSFDNSFSPHDDASQNDYKWKSPQQNVKGPHTQYGSGAGSLSKGEDNGGYKNNNLQHEYRNVIPKMASMKPMPRDGSSPGHDRQEQRGGGRRLTNPSVAMPASSSQSAGYSSTSAQGERSRTRYEGQPSKVSPPPLPTQAMQQHTSYADDDEDDFDNDGDGFEDDYGVGNNYSNYNEFDYDDDNDNEYKGNKANSTAQKKQVVSTKHKHVPVSTNVQKRPQQQEGTGSATRDATRKNQPTATSSRPAPPALPVELSQPKVVQEKDKLAYSRVPRNIEYKPNTTPLVRQGIVEIQNLKPDLNREDLVIKRVNAERIKEFAKNLQDFNRLRLQQQKKLPPSSEAVHIELDKHRIESKRAKAIEFARQIPKPKIEKGDVFSRAQKGRLGDDSYVTAADDSGLDYKEIQRLQSLEVKHQESRRQVEAIKKSMGY